MDKVLLALVEALKDEWFAQNVMGIIAMIACAVVMVLVFVLH